MKQLPTEKKIVPINELIPNPWNPNIMSKSIFEKMKLTIQEKGLFGAIYVRRFECNSIKNYQILDGQHRWEACKELGYTEIPVECAINEVSDRETQFWTIYFNNTRGRDDLEKRAELFELLDKGQIPLLPFTEEEIENEKKLFKFDFSQYETKSPEIPADTLVHVLSFRFSDEEWKVVEECLSYAKKDGMDDKQWFMSQMKQYFDLKQFRANQS
jgi:hypothetical protein